MSIFQSSVGFKKICFSGKTWLELCRTQKEEIKQFFDQTLCCSISHWSYIHSSTVKVSSLRVEGVPRVLRLDSRNRLSLHVHRIRADPRPVFPPQVAQELRVPVAGNIPLIKPGCHTGCREEGLTLQCAFFFSFVNVSFLKRFRRSDNNVELTFQCSGK